MTFTTKWITIAVLLTVSLAGCGNVPGYTMPDGEFCAAGDSYCRQCGPNNAPDGGCKYLCKDASGAPVDAGPRERRADYCLVVLPDGGI